MPKGNVSVRHEIILLALPFILFLYPAAVLLAGKSTVPTYLHRYSLNLLLFNCLNIAVYGTFLLGLVTGQRAVQFVAILSLAILTWFVLSNNLLLELPAIEATVQSTRLLTGLSMLVIALRAEKEGRRLLTRCCMALGIFCGLTGLLDLSWGLVSKFEPTDKSKLLHGSYRTTYDLTKLSDKDIVLVGDSFVWGQGVQLEQRFGDILERRLQDLGSHSRVYSLGVIGENLQGYRRQVQDVSSVQRPKHVIVFFYANDMPPRPNLQDSLEQLAVAVGRSSVSMRMIVDSVRFAITPNEEEYAKLLLTHFVEGDKTFPIRWRQLESELEDLFQDAKVRSQETPALVLLPMLTDFQKAAFDEPLHRVGQVAKHVGFRVVETMPAFRADGHSAEAYRAAPNDLHFNERGNRIVADVLFRFVTNILPP